MSGATLAGSMKAITLLRDGGTINVWQFETTADHSCVTRRSANYDDRATARSIDKSGLFGHASAFCWPLRMIERYKYKALGTLIYLFSSDQQLLFEHVCFAEIRTPNARVNRSALPFRLPKINPRATSQ
jgi:hypothetical protein